MDEKHPLGRFVGCVTVQALAFASRVMNNRTSSKIGPVMTLETERLPFSLEQGLDLGTMAVMA